MFWRHLRALVVKNVLLMRRRPLGTALELLLPLACVAALVGIWSSFPTQSYPTRHYVADSLRVPSPAVLGARLTLSNQYLALIPGSSSQRQIVHELHAWIQAEYPAFQGSAVGFTTSQLARLSSPSLGSRVILLDSEEQLAAHIKDEAYGEAGGPSKIWAAVVVKEGSIGAGTWRYSLRLNSSEVPATDGEAYDSLQRGADLTHVLDYVRSRPSFGDNLSEQSPDDPVLALRLPGWMSLQLMLDRFIINTTTADSALGSEAVRAAFADALAMWRPSAVDAFTAEMATATGAHAAAVDAGLQQWLRAERYMPQTVDLTPFPTSAYQSNDFYDVASGTFSLFLVICMLFPLSRLLSSMVADKEAKLNEGLRMAGVGAGPIMASWLITYFGLFLAIAIGAAVLSLTTFFSHTNAGVVFGMFLLFGWSAVAWCFLVHVFFSRAKSASSMGVISFLALAFPFYGVSSPTASTAGKLAASLCSPTAFGLLVNVLSTYESEGQGVSVDSTWNISYGYSAGAGLLFLAADTVLYLLLGYYLYYTLPPPFREYGTAQPWWFLCSRSHWFANAPAAPRPADHGDAVTIDAQTDVAVGAGSADVEPLTSGDVAKLRQERALILRGLRKVFPGGNGSAGDKVAVDYLDLTLVEGKTTVLLGKNGAGKSTLISMATGLIPPTTGSIRAYGLDLLTLEGSAQLSKLMGVCPQQDVLWPALTVYEHLNLFAAVKGVPEADVEAAIIKAASDVGIVDKLHTQTRALSGGQRRKTCLACAFLGGSKLIWLDEPTSGMDPYSRRSTWNVLQNAREGRIICLTTHFLDEADVLGDRIAIMSRGKLRCCGSPLFLKERFGVGYLLTCVKAAGCDGAAVLSLVQSHVPSATIHSEVGTELAMRIPLAARLDKLFAELEEGLQQLRLVTFGVSVTTMEEVFLRVAKEEEEAEVEQAAAAAAAAQKAAALAGGAHAHDNTPAAHTSAAVNPLVTAAKQPVAVDSAGNASSKLSAVLQRARAQRSWWAMFTTQVRALLIKRMHIAARDWKAMCYILLIPGIVILCGLALIGAAIPGEYPLYALTTASLNTDPRGSPVVPIHENIVPAWLFKGGQLGRDSADISDVLNAFPPANVSMWHLSSTDPAAALIASGGDAYGFIDPTSPDAHLQAMSAYLLSRRGFDMRIRSAGSVFGAVAFSSTTSMCPAQATDTLWSDDIATYTVLHNSTGVHTAPLFVNLVNSALLARTNATGGQGSGAVVADGIVAENHPLPFTARQKLLLASYQSGSAATIMMIALSFIPAAFAAYSVLERETGAKHLHLVSGLDIIAYHVSNWLFDVATYLVPGLLILGLCVAFSVTDFVSSSAHRLQAFVTLLMLYGPAVAGQTYIVSFMFHSHSSAQNAVLMLNLLCVLLMIVSMIMGQALVTDGGGPCIADSGLRYVYRLFPGFSLGNSLYALSFLSILPSLNANCKRSQGLVVTAEDLAALDAFDLSATGTNITYLAVESVGYLALAIIIDLLLVRPALRKRLFSLRPLHRLWRGWNSSRSAPVAATPGNSAATQPQQPEEDVDEDVIAERNRVLSSAARDQSDDVVQMLNLRKVYPTGKVAVVGSTLGVPIGTVFGLLGQNGSGKSTTAAMLTGDLLPTSGTACIAGLDIVSQQPAVRRLLGFVPQRDAIADLLTTEDHLALYARLKGIPESDVARVVDDSIAALDLTEARHRPAGRLSGGNKRKLSTAIALIGAPPVILMDEPTSGVDVVAQRLLWDVLSRLTSGTTARGSMAQSSATAINPDAGGCSIILTSHSMTEVEALCSRIAIMAGGKLRAIGSPQQLKSRYGQGFQVELRLLPPPAPAVAAVEVQLKMEHVPFKDLQAVCDRLGNGSLAAEVNETGRGWPLLAAFQRSTLPSAASALADKTVPAHVFASWWAEEAASDAACAFISSTFNGATLLERQGALLRFRVPSLAVSNTDKADASPATAQSTQPLRLSRMFAAFEGSKQQLGIATFSVSQTSLEDVFNALAATHGN